MDDLSEHLPIWTQVVLGTGAFLGAGFAAFIGYTRKRLHGGDHGERASGDTVLISGAMADSQPIRELTSAIRQMCGGMEKMVLMAEIGAMKTDKLVESNERIADAIQTIDDHVKKIREKQ